MDKYKNLMDLDLGKYSVVLYTGYCGIHFEEVGDGYARTSSTGPEEHYGFKQNRHKHYIFKAANARVIMNLERNHEKEE